MWRLYYTGDQAVELFTAEVKKTKLEVPIHTLKFESSLSKSQI